MQNQKLFTAIASALLARQNCLAWPDDKQKREWAAKHESRIDALVKRYLPSGSGFDCGTKIDYDKSRSEKLVFNTSFHHMDESGGYAGWSEHAVTVRASLWAGITITVSGRDRNGIKDYISEAFNALYSTEVTA